MVLRAGDISLIGMGSREDEKRENRNSEYRQ